MSVYIQNFVKFKPFLKELVSRDVKVKYRRSILGVLWTLLNPLLMMTVLSIVFSNLFKFDIENFPLYLLCGQVIFNFFNDATTNAMSAIIGSASLIKKVYVPKYVFVMSRVCSSLINLMSSCAALFLIMIGMRAELHWTMLLSVVPLFLLVVLALGIGLILATIAEIQGCSALVFGADGSADVSDTGYLSNVDSAGMVIPSGNDKPPDQYSDHVPECCDLWQTSRSGDASGDSSRSCTVSWSGMLVFL